MNAVFDTNILIDLLDGVPEARVEVRRHDRRAVSVVTWIEVLVGCRDVAEAERAGAVLGGFERIELSDGVASEAIVLRRDRRLRLPDAIILATARTLGVPLVTRNTRDFPADDPDIFVPYTL